MIEVTNPVLYILMRSDLASLNPGKAVAQGAHAANQFAFEVRRLYISNPVTTEDRRTLNLFEQWETSTRQGFGVTITLDVDGTTLSQVVAAATAMGFKAGVTHDPSYPITDGQVTHLIPLDTAGYVFGDKEKLSILLGQFNLLA